MSLPAKALRTSIHILFPYLNGIGSMYGIGVSIIKGPLETVEQSSPLFHTGHVKLKQHSVFSILVLFGVVCFNNIPYHLLSDREQCTILADCRRLAIFPISRELQCHSWHMPSHLEHSNMTKEEALYFYLFYA